MLNVNYINPFIGATLQALEMMAAVRPERGAPFVKTGRAARGDVSGIIGLAGEATGSVAVTFPGTLARRIYANLVGEEAGGITEEVCDAIGELANMIAGGAKAELSQQGCNFQIAIPTIVVGKGHTIDHKGPGPCLVVPFTLDGEEFWLEVSLAG
ncbi:MAG: chemotaxis protein CheX [Deferrisomatales bacterium]|nr:chemotaxis protein CheX [Deferrisomatales bacterium]